jgi:hypothetical protein
MIAMHGVFNGVARDEHVAVELRNRNIRNNETVAVVMENQPSFYFVAIRERRLGGLVQWLLASFAAGRVALRLAAWKSVPPAWDFLNGAALFEFRKHFEQRAGICLFELESLDDFGGGCGFAPKLQKTQYVIGIKM